MMKNLLIISCLIIFISLMGCSHNKIFDFEKRRMYTVKITSRTPGLVVYATKDGIENYIGTTPCYIYSDNAKIKYVTVRSGNIYQTIKLKTKWGESLYQGNDSGKVYSQKEYYIDL